MANRDDEVVELMIDQSLDQDEDRERPAPKRGGRFVASAFPGGPKPKERAPWSSWGGRELAPATSKFPATHAPAPQGPPTSELLDWAARRRRERARERAREGGR